MLAVLCSSIDNIILRMIFYSFVNLPLIAFFTFRIFRAKNIFIRISHALLIIGIALNTIVFLANLGSMPVLDRVYYEGVWIPMTELTLYNWLGDRFWGASIGDFFLASAIVPIPLFLLLKKLGKTNRLSSA